MSDELEIKIGDAIYSFGSPCPPIKSLFFPNDPNKKPYEIEEEEEEGEKEKNDSTQST